MAGAGRLGPSAAAAHKIGRQASTWISTSVDSIANAAQILIAARLASEPAAARAVAGRTMMMGGAAGCVLGVALWFGRGRFTALFSDDPRVSSSLSLLPSPKCGKRVRLRLRGHARVAQVRENSSLVLKSSALLAPVAAIAYILDGIALGSSDFSFLARAMVNRPLAQIIKRLLPLGCVFTIGGVL